MGTVVLSVSGDLDYDRTNSEVKKLLVWPLGGIISPQTPFQVTEKQWVAVLKIC